MEEKKSFYHRRMTKSHQTVNPLAYAFNGSNPFLPIPQQSLIDKGSAGF